MIPDTIFFLSDYGLRDTFVGVVHAVVRRLAPHAAVIDLTHQIAPYDIRGGALTLAQAVPHLGPGVVLAVVDPGVGVGGGRRCVAVSAPEDSLWMVGPDNGLLVPALDELGGSDHAHAWALPAPLPVRDTATFDGRDVLAPVAAALCRGDDPASLGDTIDPSSLVRLPGPVVERHARGGDGRFTLRAEVTGLDRFGNVQLAARRADLPSSMPPPAESPMLLGVTLTPAVPHPERADGVQHEARWVTTFGDLEPGELGLLVDSTGSLALVLPEASAGASLCITTGDLVELTL